MSRILSTALALHVLAFGSDFSPPRTASAAEKVARDRAAELVQQALRQEIDGTPEDRETLLRQTRDQFAKSAPARWHSGFVRSGKTWVEFENAFENDATTKLLQRYRGIRGTFSKSVAGRLQLANWCRANRLSEQERAHLTELLEISPNHTEARGRLGFRLVSGVWMSTREIEDARKRTGRAIQALTVWQPKLQAIRGDLSDRNRRRRQSAAKRLLAIDDPEAILAMELVLSRFAVEAALLVVEALDNMAEHEATLALARQAVFSPFEPVQKSAVEKLKPRNPQHYIPALVSSIYTPIQSRTELFRSPGSRLTYRHIFYREGQLNKQTAVLETVYNMQGGRRNRRGARRNSFETRANQLNVARQLNDSRRAREAMMAEQNRWIENVNARVSTVLAAVTEQEPPQSPQQWWTWWNEEEGVYVEDKQWDVAYQSEVGIPEPIPGVTGRTCECLAAGTPVWTDRGAVAIERIAVGDQVLSKHPETGRLAYKPVLRTTVRPAGRLVKMRLDGEVIESSDGHPFWISGKGWVLAKRIKAGMRLHGVRGCSHVQSVQPGGFAKTYNLIVADFHTYFAGNSKILSHDNTIRKPTDNVVPGLAAK